LDFPKLQTHHHNGTGEAPHQNGASLVTSAQPAQQPQPATRIPTPPQARGFAPWLYHLTNFQFSGIPPLRLVYTGLALLALLWLVGLLPGRWWGVAFVLLLAAAIAGVVRVWRSRDYVRFAAEPVAGLIPAPLAASEKIPIFATGCFTVEGKSHRFTQLPGYYRTFATREHALLCILTDRPWLKIGHLPEALYGMWYVFIDPATIRHVDGGILHFGATHWPAIAVQYEIQIPARGRLRAAQVRTETLYLVPENPAQLSLLLGDLLYDARPAHPAQSSTPHSST
jgi:hypothetical protein